MNKAVGFILSLMLFFPLACKKVTVSPITVDQPVTILLTATATATDTPTVTNTPTITDTPTVTATMTMTPPLPPPSGMIVVPAGSFWMGSPDGVGFADERPRHEVYLDAFYMDTHEVTFDEYDAFCAATSIAAPSDAGWGRGTRPVIYINWSEAKAYCEWAGKRLPTEAEWEKAARGGTDTRWHFGDEETSLGVYAWYHDNSGNMTHPVGEKLPNQYGLYDMHGNVFEWVLDWYDGGYYAVSPSSNPPGPASGTYRVLRGGSWDDFAFNARSAVRNMGFPDYRSIHYGCRCARTP